MKIKDSSYTLHANVDSFIINESRSLFAAHGYNEVLPHTFLFDPKVGSPIDKCMFLAQQHHPNQYFCSWSYGVVGFEKEMKCSWLYFMFLVTNCSNSLECHSIISEHLTQVVTPICVRLGRPIPMYDLVIQYKSALDTLRIRGETTGWGSPWTLQNMFTISREHGTNPFFIPQCPENWFGKGEDYLGAIGLEEMFCPSKDEARLVESGVMIAPILGPIYHTATFKSEDHASKIGGNFSLENQEDDLYTLVGINVSSLSSSIIGFSEEHSNEGKEKGKEE